jgi:hypothetical protein
MLMYMLIGILLIGCLGLLLSQIALNHRPTDSALKQRAIFSPQQQLTYTRLKTLLPELHILAQVSFDALLTTKYPRTRYKYRNMVADFVLLDQDHHIIAMIALSEAQGLKRLKNAYYEDDLLKMAGYKVLRYQHVPELSELKRDFLNAHIIDDQTLETPQRDKRYHLSHVPM